MSHGLSTIPDILKSKCCGCQRTFRKETLKRNACHVGERTLARTRLYFINNTIEINDLICGSCRQNVNKNKIKKPVEEKNNSFPEISETEKSAKENNIKNTIIEDKKIKKSIAPYTHKNCLICKQKNGLHAIKINSILKAYEIYGIIIKAQTLCCGKHLDADGEIKIEEYVNIPKRPHYFEKAAIQLLDLSILQSVKIQNTLTQACGIFDKFKNMSSLEEKDCVLITGWTKIEFDNFCSLIKSVRDTCGRTKLQLVAIYRYWLLKGIDQTTLALLKSETSQQQISHYLAQIREAINKDFVHLFLGANKEKNFFLNHNTQSVKVLHSLEPDTLAIIADGLYTRLEKSSNNQFQYASFSVQKKQNLIKPFIVCCADGYFIDCYGPFQANLNDSTIFRYILSTDDDLKNLLTPKNKIIMFLDRGN